MAEEILYHYYPWSSDRPEETCASGRDFPFFGFPSFSSPQHIRVIITRPFDISFWGRSISTRQFFSLPINIGFKGEVNLSWSANTKIETSPLGSFSNLEDQYKQGEDGNKIDSDVSDIVQDWLAFFDELIGWVGNDQAASDEVIEFLAHLSEHEQEPRLDLIVQIAEKMNATTADIIQSPRRVLARNRDMVSIGKIDEIDAHCLRWFVKQPGEDFVEKGGFKQELMGVIRYSSTNTLENRVFRDFIKLCVQRAREYQISTLRFSRGDRSQRVKIVTRFRNICKNGLISESFASLPSSVTGVQPNYVLQADARYAPVWRWYRKLVHQEKAKDSAWSWQCNTWCDIGCLLLALAISKIKDGGRQYKPLLSSKVQFLNDQDMGTRMLGSSLPGPFVLEADNAITNVLEVVHYKDVAEHDECAKISSLGGHLYLVNHQVNSSKPFEYVVCWFLNTIAVKNNKPSVEEMALSAKAALGRVSGKKMTGLIVINTKESTRVEKFFNGQIQVVSINVEPFNWHKVVVGDFQKAIADALWR